jgi:hypothetical protein
VKWVIFRPGCVEWLLYQGKLAIIEGKSLRPHFRIDPLPYPPLRLFESAVVAVRVVASAIKEYVGCPGTASTA